jgi:hypothetical protein
MQTIDKPSQNIYLSIVVLSLLFIWILISSVWWGIYDWLNLDFNQHIIYYDNAMILLLLLNLFLIYARRSSLKSYKIFVLIIFILFTLYTYILTIHNMGNPLSSFSIFRNGLLCLLILLNIHYISMLCNNHYPFFKDNLNRIANSLNKMPATNICLNWIYLICIMVIIMFFYASFNIVHLPDYIKIFSDNSDFLKSFDAYLIYLYLLQFIFFATLSMHVWLNLSIGYPLLLVLLRANCVDLRDRIQYKNLIYLRNYFIQTSYIYLFLLICGITFFEVMPSLENNPGIDNLLKYSSFVYKFRTDTYLLSIPLFINLTICFFGFLRLNSLVQDYVSNRYQKMYTQFIKKELDLEHLDKKFSILKNTSHPFDIRVNNILIISEAISLLYLIKATQFIISSLL